MRPRFATVILLAFLAPAALAETWKGTLVREGAVLPVSVTFSGAGAATLSSPTQRALDIPLRNVRREGDAVHFELVGDATTIVFDGRVVGDTIAGSFREGVGAGELTLRRAAAEAVPYRVEEARFANGNVTLAGSLLCRRGRVRIRR